MQQTPCPSGDRLTTPREQSGGAEGCLQGILWTISWLRSILAIVILSLSELGGRKLLERRERMPVSLVLGAAQRYVNNSYI